MSLTSRVEGFGGALLIVTLSYYPLVYLPVAAALRGLDPALEETALSLGHGPWRTFVRVVLPQLRPAMLGGALLVGLHLLAEFGALQLLRFADLHHRHLRPVPLLVQRPRRHHAGRRAGAAAAWLLLLLELRAARPPPLRPGRRRRRPQPARGAASAGPSCRCWPR